MGVKLSVYGCALTIFENFMSTLACLRGCELLRFLVIEALSRRESLWRLRFVKVRVASNCLGIFWFLLLGGKLEFMEDDFTDIREVSSLTIRSLGSFWINQWINHGRVLG